MDIGDSCARAGMGAMALQLSGFPKDPLIAPAVRFMQNYGPAWNFEYPGDGYPFYYWYYGTRVMYLVGGEDWRVWKDYMCRFLVDNQDEKGGWGGGQSEESEALVTYRAAFGALMLEFCCGHVPIYMSAPRRKEPGAVGVVFEKDAEEEGPKAVEIIMDASNSMTGVVGKETKIAVARRVLTQTIEGLPETMKVGLRVYGHRFATDDYDNACRDTELVVPIGPVDKAALVDRVNKIQTKGRTPLVASVLAAIKDFEKIPNGTIVLVTDGIESCKGDIKSIAPAIKAAGMELKVNIVGFDIKEAAGRAELESIAKSTGGRYLDARNAGELLKALEQTLKLEFVAVDAMGKEHGRGAVGGDAIKLAPGGYTIRVLVSPESVELKVTVKSGAAATYTLKKTAGGWILE
jgi:Mg-chelatase subunit ChlD